MNIPLQRIFCFADPMEKFNVKLSAAQKDLIEKLGITYENTGMSAVSARILALLLVADDPDLSFDQLRSTLGISKSATSNSLTLLINTGKIEQVTKLGERKRYFRNRVAHWKEDMKKKNEQTTFLIEILKQVLKQRPRSTTEFNTNLKELIHFVEFIQKELPLLYKKWEASKH